MRTMSMSWMSQWVVVLLVSLALAGPVLAQAPTEGMEGRSTKDPARGSANESMEVSATESAEDSADEEVSARNALTLPALIERALERHPSLTALDEERQAQLASSEAAGTFPDPTVSLGYSYAPLSLSFTEDEMTMLEGMVSQTFPWFGKRELRRRGPAILADALSRDRDARALALSADVAESYARLWLAAESRRILEQQRTALANFARLARARFSTMGTSQGDPIRAELELARLEEAFSDVAEAEALARARLASLVVAGRQELEGEPAPLPDIQVPESLDALIDSLDRHPALVALDFRRSERETASELASKEAIPDVGVGLMYSHRRIDRDFVSLEVSVPIPVFGRTRARRESEAALAQASAVSAEYLETRNDLLSEARAAHATALSRQRLMSHYETVLLPRARKNVEVASAAYRAGEVDVLMVIDAQVFLFEQELALASSRAAHLSAVARLEAALGERRFLGAMD